MDSIKVKGSKNEIYKSLSQSPKKKDKYEKTNKDNELLETAIMEYMLKKNYLNTLDTF